MTETIITCAVTGNIATRQQHPELPVTPKEIAEVSLLAADAGATIVYIHVRDPVTTMGSMNLDLYRDVVEHIRARNKSLIPNLTTGPEGRFVPSSEDPKVAAPGTTLTSPERRVAHVPVLMPEICSLDLNTMNSGAQVVINTPKSVTRMAEIIFVRIGRQLRFWGDARNNDVCKVDAPATGGMDWVRYWAICIPHGRTEAVPEFRTRL